MLLDVTSRGPVMTLTLMRPERRNALNQQLLVDLNAALDQAASDATARLLVLTGSGSIFCAGADTKAASDEAADFANLVPQLLSDVLARMLDHPKPIIGRIQGGAFGGGLGLIAACDLTVAAESARFAFSEVRLGVVPAAISPFVLRKMSPTAAAQLMLTGEVVSSRRLHDVGLLTSVVADDALDAVVDGWCEQLLLGGPQALAVTKRVLSRVPSMSRAAALSWSIRVSEAGFASEEGAEGMRARAEKRPASWAAQER